MSNAKKSPKKHSVVRAGQIWASNDKRRERLEIEILAVGKQYATVRSVQLKPGRPVEREVKLSRFNKHDGYKLVDRATVNLVNAANPLLDNPVEPVRQQVTPTTLQVHGTGGVNAPVPAINTATGIPLPPTGPGTVDVHEEVTAEHPILR